MAIMEYKMPGRNFIRYYIYTVLVMRSGNKAAFDWFQIAMRVYFIHLHLLFDNYKSLAYTEGHYQLKINSKKRIWSIDRVPLNEQFTILKC